MHQEHSGREQFLLTLGSYLYNLAVIGQLTITSLCLTKKCVLSFMSDRHCEKRRVVPAGTIAAVCQRRPEMPGSQLKCRLRRLQADTDEQELAAVHWLF